MGNYGIYTLHTRCGNYSTNARSVEQAYKSLFNARVFCGPFSMVQGYTFKPIEG